MVALTTLLLAYHRAELIVQYGDETGKTVISNKVLERVKIDYTPIDVIIVGQNNHSGVKLMPTYLMDRATKYIVGFFIESGES